MILHGREIGLLLTVGAMGRIMDLCPDKDIKNVGALMNQPGSARFEVLAKIVQILADGYAESQKFSDPDWKAPDPVTEEELMSLPYGEYRMVEAEAVAAFAEGMGVTVEAESGNEKKTEAAASK